jgi:hypothetical protein
VPLEAEPLGTGATFSVVNATRCVPAGGGHQLLVSFTPPSGGAFSEDLLLRSSKQRVRVRLLGRGAAPEVSWAWGKKNNVAVKPSSSSGQAAAGSRWP